MILEREKVKMYSKFFAVFLNCIFAICLSYTSLVLCIMCISDFEIEINFLIGFLLYNIVWLVIDIDYNVSRYQKQGADLFFWMSIILPAIMSLILLWVTILFF